MPTRIAAVHPITASQMGEAVATFQMWVVPREGQPPATFNDEVLPVMTGLILV